MNSFGDIYRGRRVLVTGHTGFKGSWLAAWLTGLGAEVHGVSLMPETQPNHWDLLGIKIDDRRMDIRDPDTLQRVVHEINPEVVFHLAAQSLVRRSHERPLDTWSTNVMGTAALLESCRSAKELKAIVVVTTDKCYENREWPWGYRETDRLGGSDPYAASKAAAELVTASYRTTYFSAPQAAQVATARAGNVIGGGDWSEDRLIPDAVRSLDSDRPLEVRHPMAVRPWQHVLDPLAGYLILGQHLLSTSSAASAWNFGPGPEGQRPVAGVLDAFKALEPSLDWRPVSSDGPRETTLLYLDSSRAHRLLGWSPVWNFHRAMEETAAWYRAFRKNKTVSTLEQIRLYESDASAQHQPWRTN